jgi:hypothetical protein
LGDLLVCRAVAFGLPIGRCGGGFAADKALVHRGGARNGGLAGGAFRIRIKVVGSQIVGIRVVCISIMRGFLQFSTDEIYTLTINLLMMIGIHKYGSFHNFLPHAITRLPRMMMRMMVLLKSCSLHYFLVLFS